MKATRNIENSIDNAPDDDVRDKRSIEPMTAEEIANRDRRLMLGLLDDKMAEIATLQRDVLRWRIYAGKLHAAAAPIVWSVLKVAAGKAGMETETCRLLCVSRTIVAEKRGNGRGFWFVREDSLMAHVAPHRRLALVPE